MRALVAYESLFGNTRDVAQAVAAGVRTAWPTAIVDCVCIDATVAEPSPAAADLVIVGAPTHIWGMTSRISRAMEHEYELRAGEPVGTRDREIPQSAVTPSHFDIHCSFTGGNDERNSPRGT